MSYAMVFALCRLAQDGGVVSHDRVEWQILNWRAEHGGDVDGNQAATREAAYEQKQFVDKFNHLLDTLRDFADQYNHNMLDVKKVKAVKKAWRDLEKTDAWFRLEEKSVR